MARWAILSDVHGNLDALEAVLRDAEAQGAERVAVLGDHVDYGPEPAACLARIQAVADVWLVGNHERDVVAPSDDNEPLFAGVSTWTREALADAPAWRALLERVEALGWDAAAQHEEGSLHLVHAAPDAPLDQYLWPGHEAQYLLFNEAIDESLAAALASFARPHGFVGHTHVPALLVERRHHGVFDPFAHPCEREPTYTFVGARTVFFVPDGEATIDGLSDKRFAANPGSVGFPRRLGDPRSAYALFDGDRLTLRRVDYPRDAVMAKLAAVGLEPELEEMLLDNLRTGR